MRNSSSLVKLADQASSRLSRSRHLGVGGVLLGVALGMVIGCGSSGPQMGRVSGKVTYQGQPVANATVTFLPDAAGSQSATGITDASGEYQLSTFGKNDGALVGKHRANVVARAAFEGKLPPGAGEAMLEEFQSVGKPLIPQKYFNVETSGLSFDVQSGSNQIDLVLTD
jgi:hypothetical protein